MHYSKKSESFCNILNAFDKEAAGHVRYTILEEDASRRGNTDLAMLYGELAREELNHAKIWYKEAHGENEEDELENSIARETDSAVNSYISMANTAELEGYEMLADKLLANGRAEATHRDRLIKYRDEKKDGSRYRCHEEAVWECGICGHGHTGTTPPKACPLCGYGENAYRKASN